MYTFSFLCIVLRFVFFFKQKTAYEMRISDWSSDVCSSDLKTVSPVRDPVSRIPCRDDSPMAKLSLMLLAAPLATAGFSLPAAANPAAQDDGERPPAIVRYAALNLSSAEGRGRLTTIGSAHV